MISKVLLISFPRRGGMVHHNIQLANSLGKYLDLSVIIDASANQYIYGHSVKTETINSGKGALGTTLLVLNPLIYIRILQIIKRINPEIIHFTSAHAINPTLGILIKWFIGKPIVYTIHDPIQHEGGPLYIRIVDTIFRRFVSGFVIHSYEHKKRIEKYSKPIAVLPLGIFDQFIEVGQRDKEDIEEDVILFFGRIEPYKGLDVLLEAAPKIFEVLPDWRILIAGNGSLRPYQQLIGDDRIIVINKYIEDNDISNLFRKAKMVVLPYKAATQSGVIPLAYAFSKAVIATRVGGIPDIVENYKTGILISPNDINALKESVITLAENELLRRSLGKNGRAYAQKELNWDKIAKKHIDHYISILRRTA